MFAHALVCFVDDRASSLVALFANLYCPESTSYMMRILLVHINNDVITEVLSNEVAVSVKMISRDDLLTIDESKTPAPQHV